MYDLSKNNMNELIKMPFVFLVDTSGLMNPSRKGKTIKVIERFLKSLALEYSNHFYDYVDFAVVEFNSTVSVVKEFGRITEPLNRSFNIGDARVIGQAIETAYEMIKNRTRYYIEELGIDIYKPLVLMITDGVASDDVSRAAELVRHVESTNKCLFMAVGIEGSNINELSNVIPKSFDLKNSDVSLYEILKASFALFFKGYINDMNYKSGVKADLHCIPCDKVKYENPVKNENSTLITGNESWVINYLCD